MEMDKLFDLAHTRAADYLREFRYPWEALAGIEEMVFALGNRLESTFFHQISPGVWVHKTAKVAPTAYLGAPCVIGADTEVRHCAFIRGSALVGDGCVVGNSTELKNGILFDGVQVPHYNYLGDSILGYKAHFGAGAVTSNVKGDRSPVVIHGEQEIPTGRKKVGAMVGDYGEIGCHAVLNPGTVIGRHSRVYPGACVRGVVGENCIYKKDGAVVEMR